MSKSGNLQLWGKTERSEVNDGSFGASPKMSRNNHHGPLQPINGAHLDFDTSKQPNCRVY